MTRALAMLLAMAATASATAQQSPFDARLERVRAEAEASAKAAAALDAEATRARDEATRLSLEIRARAEAIAAAEARLSETSIELESLTAARAQIEQRLASERRPLAHLIAGLATLSRQPPLATLADASSTAELVRLQLLIGASIPAIEQRTAALEADLDDLASLDRQTRASLAELEERRETLASDRERFAEAEARQRAAVTALETAAFSATGRRMAVREELAEIEDEATSRRKALDEAEAMATYPSPPLDARRGATPDTRPDFAYRLPSDAPVTAGLGSVTADGIRARGLTQATTRGMRIVVPADGTVRFASALRERDHVLVIDHGDGWLSLLTGVASNVAVGDPVRRGAPLGRATGPIGVELWVTGRPVSPALIAGSSDAL